VVDNHSADDSAGYLSILFPDYHLIVNDVNIGFSKACNQGLAIATGTYILFLNPDTIVPEDCFRLCVKFMEDHSDAGALGVRMVNGKGEFLKESKRGLPGPLVSFWKMTGLAKRFPESPVFSRYYLGHLSDNEVHEIEVISGAFFFCRKTTLDITGGFDERFFMYAEDIDLSYRIIKSGYRNYYFPFTTILHYKGESTIKNADYVKQFYKAMRQFSSKYTRTGSMKKIIALGISAKTSLELSLVKPVSAGAYTTLQVDEKHSVNELIKFMEDNRGREYRIVFK
jgi:GT2 family glycosyltransferase